MNRGKTSVVFFGTPEFALPILEALWSMRPAVELVSVITAADKPVGRKQVLTPPPAKVWAQEHGIFLLQPEKLDEKFVEQLRALEPTVGVIASYGKIIPKAVLELFPKSVLNVHPSLLPRWRGASPVQSAIAAGDTETGVTIMLTDEEMDHGPVLAQERYPLKGNEMTSVLRSTLAEKGAALLSKTLLPWVRGEIEPKLQDESRVSVSSILKREDGRLDWNESSEQISRKVRAYEPWPGVFTTLPDGKRLKILSAEAAEEGQSPLGGTVEADREGYPLVRVADGWLRLIRVQPEGKSPMDGDSFLRGATSCSLSAS